MFFDLTDVNGKRVIQNEDEVGSFHEINFEDRGKLGLPNNTVTLMKMKPYNREVRAIPLSTKIIEIIAQGKWKVVN